MSAPQYVMMPASYKAILTAMVMTAAGVFGWLNLDNGIVGYVVFVLGGFMILGIWIFPDNDEITVPPAPGENSESGAAGSSSS